MNSAPLAPGAYIVSNIKEQSKIIGNKLLEVSTMLKVIASRDETPIDSMNISALYAEISLAFSDLLPLDQLSLLPKKCDCSVFFEAFAEETKLSGIKSQKLLAKVQQLKKKQLTQKIETLGKSFEENHLSIAQAEKELSTLCDTELRDKLRELKVFEILNAEKANPHFLELAKKTTTISENLSDI